MSETSHFIHATDVGKIEWKFHEYNFKVYCSFFYFDKAPSKKEVNRIENKTELSCRLNQQHTQYFFETEGR